MTTMTPAPGTVTGGVDTHADLHVAAAVDHLGGVLGTAQFATTPAGYRRLLGWLRTFGPLHQVGVEGTGKPAFAATDVAAWASAGTCEGPAQRRQAPDLMPGAGVHQGSKGAGACARERGRAFSWAGMMLSLSILCSACSGADADPCEVLTAQDVAEVLRVNGLVATESPLSGAGRICNYGVPGPSSSEPQVASTPLFNLQISDIATYADFDREADLLAGHRELRLADVDRATISTVDGGSGSASLVRGDRTASLHLYDAGLSVQEQQRTLKELATRVVEHWSDMDA